MRWRGWKKNGVGYAGFETIVSGVNLVDDLARRDLTMNAMALPREKALRVLNGEALFNVSDVIDPFDGLKDINSKKLRHVAVAFAEDPLRVLRVARFAARYEGFEVDEHTALLMEDLVLKGEVDALVPERIWKEVSRGLMEKAPEAMMRVMHDCGALARVWPEVMNTDINEITRRLKRCADSKLSLRERVAAIMASHTELDSKGVKEKEASKRRQTTSSLAKRWALPNDVKDLCEVVALELGGVKNSKEWPAKELDSLCARLDVSRRPWRMRELLSVASLVLNEAEKEGVDFLTGALNVAIEIKVDDLVARAKELGWHGGALGKEIRERRLERLSEYVAEQQNVPAVARMKQKRM